MSALVYHHTNTAHLPWILYSGELQLGKSKVGDFPDPDFLWATTDANGDSTASFSLEAYRAGILDRVRFTLSADDFEKWPDITRDFPAWTPDHIARLGRVKNARSDLWRARSEPLPRLAWVQIHTRSYRRPSWRPLPMTLRVYVVKDEPIRAIKLDGRLHASKRTILPSGRIRYDLCESTGIDDETLARLACA
jgi:hypothetical protein